MDRRTLLAVALMAVVIIVTPMLFPSRRPTTRPAPTAPAAGPDTVAATAPPVQPPPPVAAGQPSVPAPPPQSAPVAPHAPATIGGTLVTSAARYAFLNPGAVPAFVRVPGYRDLTPALRTRDSTVVVRGGPALLGYRLARGADTVALDTLAFTVSQSPSAVTFASAPITIRYQTTSDAYRTAVRVSLAGAPGGAALLIDLPTTFQSVEADRTDDIRHFAFGFKTPLHDVTSVPFSKLDTIARIDTASLQWVSARSKYWLVALMQPVGEKPAAVFQGIVMRRGPLVAKVAPTASATTLAPVVNGQLAFDLYIGPQSWQELHALGNGLENVNPYAGWLHAVVQPFATIVMRVLLWMKGTFHLNYGWVLVLFGVVIRLVLWPLNQKAMRTSIQMQRLQPELTEIQKRYAKDPEKQREALVKVYQAHGMSPFSPMLGCLPMLLPMPVLFALYFVFQNTIEFRGVSFLWLPDISLRDPYYIIPLVMGISMFVLSWIGMRAAPPNPQAKMMSYMMPVMFTVMFLNFASGLNLYYAVQNIAALPQQWIITRERAKAGVGGGGGMPAAPARRTG